MEYFIFILAYFMLSIPFFYLIKWILSKFKLGKEKNRKYIAILPTIVLSPILYLAIFFVILFAYAYYPKEEFNHVEWIKYPQKRYEMSENIIESNMLIGKSKDEVIKLLGSDYSISNDSIYYEIGLLPGLFRLDSDVLVIYFENNIVVRVGQHES